MLSVTNVMLSIGFISIITILVRVIGNVLYHIKRNNQTLVQQKLKIESLKTEIEHKILAKTLKKERISHTWSGFRKFIIQDKIKECEGICSFYLVPCDNKELPDFEPGQHLTFKLQIPNIEKVIVRCYSLSDSPDKKGYYRISIKHALPPPSEPDAPSGQSSTFFHGLEKGAMIDVRPPSGNFYLPEHKIPMVFICSGIGLTPLLSMVNAIVHNKDGREVWFFYGVRSGEDHMMRDHLAQINQEHKNINIRTCYSRPRPDIDKEGVDYDYAGRLSIDYLKKILPSNNFDFFICGPSGMMKSTVNDLIKWGVLKKFIHFEEFNFASVKSQISNTTDKVISVEFEKSEKSCKWDSTKGTLLDLAELEGIEIESGCRAGNCGTCATRLYSGEIIYNNTPGAAIDPGFCLPCVGIPNSKIVIDA